MKSLQIYPVILLVLLFCACGQKKAPKIVGSSDASQAPRWSVRLVAKCAGPAEDCSAGYGFSVGSDGVYRVGPGPQGQVLSGPVGTESIRELESILEKNFDEASMEALEEQCVSDADGGVGEIGANDTVFLQRRGAEKEIIHVSSKFCASATNLEPAKSLYLLLKKIGAELYPLPFPDSNCDKENAAVEALYSSVRRCSVDSDCAYVDADFQLVPDGVLKFVIGGDCSGVRPLVVGNRDAVEKKQELLLGLTQRARDACRSSDASSCAGFGEFHPTRPGPACRAGMCHVDPISELR